MSTIKGIKIKKGEFELALPDLEILDQGVTAITGPSGSGKSTLFRILMGLDECPGFSWVLDGADLGKLTVAERRLGVVFQNLELFPHMTAKQNILIAGTARGIPAQESHNHLLKLSEALGLIRTLDVLVTNLSGGERQRVALARALMGSPRAILLDEPFSSLDEGHKDEARSLVKRVLQDWRIPTLLISHDERDTSFLAQKIYRLKSGRLDT
jgi:sulfate transport system ATP-binding protein/putative spermidine/putrescine transport system ATP-binding protein